MNSVHAQQALETMHILCSQGMLFPSDLAVLALHDDSFNTRTIVHSMVMNKYSDE